MEKPLICGLRCNDGSRRDFSPLTTISLKTAFVLQSVMSSIFKPITLGSMEIKNRIMRSATTSYWSDDRGILRPEILQLYRRLAAGDPGLIVKGHLYVQDSGKAHPGMAGISHDFHIPQLRKLTDEVHKYGVKIVAQLNHGGIQSSSDRAGPSPYAGTGWEARGLASDEIDVIVEAFGDAAERAVAAGFDGVQIHGAHGYLVSQFLSRQVNQRTDEWGGILDKRMRLLFEVYDSIREKIGERVPVLLKMNCDDFSPRGFTIKDSVKVAEAISTKGLNMLEVSGGGVGRQSNLSERARSLDPELKEASFAEYARQIREVTRPMPVALVHGIRTRRCMNAILDQGVADLISMGRPFIREPDLVQRLKAGQATATCTSCGVCSSREVFGKMMLRCHLDEGRETH
jgi:2,4-dienoyl-CoA reductase-like NADH-dependent reductase (Old Yellow Enzyme family)